MARKRIKVKPGKTQSLVGFVAAVLFVVFGCVVAIPTFGFFGVIWTAIAALIAFSNLRNALSKEGVPSHEIIIDEEGNAIEDVEAKLIKLNSLYEQGLITKEEYDAKRKEVLDQEF